MKTMNKIVLSVFALLFSVLCFSCADGIKDVAGSSSDWSSGAGYSWGSGSSGSGSSSSSSWISGKTYSCTQANAKTFYTFNADGTVSLNGTRLQASKWSVSGNTVTITGGLTFTSNDDHTELTYMNVTYTLEE